MFSFKRNAECFDKLIRDELIVILEKNIPDIVDFIMNDYDLKLTGAVTDRRSRTRPEIFYDEFKDTLLEFIEVEYDEKNVFINIPNMDNFKFEGRLKVLKHIFEGTIGVYAEVSADQYEKLFGKKPISEDPLDESVSKKEMIYIIRYDAKLRKLEKDKLNDKLVIYPFSNTPPIDIFESGEKFYDDNIDKWIEEAVDKAQIRYQKECF